MPADEVLPNLPSLLGWVMGCYLVVSEAECRIIFTIVRATLREHVLSRRVSSSSLRKALRLMSDRDGFMLPFFRACKTLTSARFSARSVPK
jgi:hypothetical protein